MLFKLSYLSQILHLPYNPSLGFGIALRIRKPTSDWNPDSKFFWQGICNPVLGIQNPQTVLGHLKRGGGAKRIAQ